MLSFFPKRSYAHMFDGSHGKTIYNYHSKDNKVKTVKNIYLQHTKTYPSISTRREFKIKREATKHLINGCYKSLR